MRLMFEGMWQDMRVSQTREFLLFMQCGTRCAVESSQESRVNIKTLYIPAVQWLGQPCNGSPYTDAAVQWLQQHGKNIWSKQATEIILSGCSAGGAATLLNADRLKNDFFAFYPRLKKYRALILSGVFWSIPLERETAKFGKTVAQKTHWFDTVQPWVAKKCSVGGKTQSWRCLSPEHAYPLVEVPVFVVQSSLDSVWLEEVLQLRGGEDGYEGR